MQKTIMVVKGSENQGKTESITTMFSALEKKGHKAQEYTETQGTKETVGTITYHTAKIGFCSIGDPNSSQKDNLEKLIFEENCDIIITASRTRGKTTDIISNLANVNNYNIIWTSNYACDIQHKLQSNLNMLFAKSLIQLVKEIIKTDEK